MLSGKHDTDEKTLYVCNREMDIIKIKMKFYNEVERKETSKIHIKKASKNSIKLLNVALRTLNK